MIIGETECDVYSYENSINCCIKIPSTMEYFNLAKGFHLFSIKLIIDTFLVSIESCPADSKLVHDILITASRVKQ